MDHAKQLKIISRAWGRNQTGFVFFPYIDRDEQAAQGIRRAGFYEGPAFEWPKDRDKILAHFAAHTEHDLYWCPSLFEYDNRRTDLAADEHSLWADLDTADPRKIDDFPPTVAWETSPGRYQGLWIISQGDVQGASWPGGENQRLTYYLGADPSGWDTTQLLRVPGWQNHKLEYREKYGGPPEGRVLWTNGRTYLPDEFEDLPEVQGAGSASDLTDAIIDEISSVDHHQVLARVKLKLNRRIRDLLGAKAAAGDRSDALWEIERSLADVGCSLAEIVAVVRQTVWNKYEGRADEYKRLILEATKAIANKSSTQTDKEELLREDSQAAIPQRLDILLANLRPPEWLVKDILTRGGLGFIAGEPKSFKSWFGLDLAISVASGARFLNHFDVLDPGPVLYLQEEDSGQIIQSRWKKILEDKAIDRLELTGPDSADWIPRSPVASDAPINTLLQSGLILSEGVWQEWLDETLGKGMLTAQGSTEAYRMVLIDTMMMTAGSVEENRSQEMTTKFFKPLKQLARKHGTSLILVHHLNKASDNGKRPGQRMLGSVANHAWAEDSMYLSLTNTGDVQMETESKSWKPKKYRVTGVSSEIGWKPTLADRINKKGEIVTKNWTDSDELVQALTALGPRARSTREIADYIDIPWNASTRRKLNNQLTRRVDQGKLKKLQTSRTGTIRWALS